MKGIFESDASLLKVYRGQTIAEILRFIRLREEVDSRISFSIDSEYDNRVTLRDYIEGYVKSNRSLAQPLILVSENKPRDLESQSF